MSHLSASKVSVKDAAAYYGVDPSTVRRWISQGLLSAERVGPKLLRVELAELEVAV